jgi:hypothetical protein
MQVELSLRERFSPQPAWPMAGKVSLEVLAANTKSGFLHSDVNWLSGSSKELFSDDKEDDLLPAWHGTAFSGPLPAGGASRPTSPNEIFCSMPTQGPLSSANDSPRSAVSLEPVGEAEEEAHQCVASKAGEALLRQLRGGALMHNNTLYRTELPPMPSAANIQLPCKELPMESHFTEGLLGWQSGALDLRPSAATRRVSEEEVCTRIEMAMSRCWSSKYATVI